MAWVRVDDKMARGPKVKRAAAKLGGRFPRRRVLAVWLEAMSYCNLNLTDGFVPDFEVADIEDEKPADVFKAMAVNDSALGAIVERDDTRGGWVFRNYHDYQPSKASIEEKAEIDRKRKAEYRASKLRPSVVRECPNGTDTDGANLSTPTGPIRTDPTRTVPLDFCSEPAETAVSEPAVMTAPTIGTGAKEWPLTQSRIDVWVGAYPGVDVVGECRRAIAWLHSNPTKRKTPKGMPRFLNAWIAESVNRNNRGQSVRGKETISERAIRSHTEFVATLPKDRPERPAATPPRPTRQIASGE